MLQNLLNSSGAQTAARRAEQLKNYVERESITQGLQEEGVQLNTFEDVMKSSLNVHTRFNTNKPSVTTKPFGSLTARNVDAQFLSNIIDDDADSDNDFPLIDFQEIHYEPAEDKISSPVVKSSSSDKSHIKSLISKISKKHGIDEKLVNAVIKQESGYNTKAKSSAGAKGLMQLMPATAKSLGVSDPYNPAQNVDGGVRYLKSMLNRYNGNVVLALAAYNAGPGNVDKYNGVPPFKETQNYVKNILANYL